MPRKHKPSPGWRQYLVNAQTEINRSVWAMNAQDNPDFHVIERTDAEWREYIKTHAKSARADLGAALERLG